MTKRRSVPLMLLMWPQVGINKYDFERCGHTQHQGKPISRVCPTMTLRLYVWMRSLER
jgi:hypothetical protein